MTAQGTPTASTARDEPAVTLAEIRRRVEEAQRREQERARQRAGGPVPTADMTRPGSLVSGDPFEGTLLSAPERRIGDTGQRTFTGLGPEGAGPAGQGRAPAGQAPARPRGDVVLGREGPTTRAAPRLAPSVAPAARAVRSSERAAAAEIGAERRRDGGRRGATGAKATLSRAGALRTDKDGVIAGLIWHEVLSPPRALRRWRER